MGWKLGLLERFDLILGGCRIEERCLLYVTQSIRVQCRYYSEKKKYIYIYISFFFSIDQHDVVNSLATSVVLWSIHGIIKVGAAPN